MEKFVTGLVLTLIVGGIAIALDYYEGGKYIEYRN